MEQSVTKTTIYAKTFIVNEMSHLQGGVAHISYTMGRSATAVKLRVNGQFEIFSKVSKGRNGQGSSKILAIKLARASSMQCCNKIFWSRL